MTKIIRNSEDNFPAEPYNMCNTIASMKGYQPVI